jgi:hypothetical protein
MLVVILKIRHSHSGQASQLIPGIRGIFEVLNAFAGDADFIANGLGKRTWPGAFFAIVMLAGLIPAGWGKGKRAGGLENDPQTESPVRRWGGVLIVSWLACTILIPFILSMMSVPMFSSRYMVAGSLAFLLLMARGIERIPWRLAGWVLGAGAIATQLYILIPYYTQVNKEQWREVALDVESRAQPGDLLVFHAPYCRSCVYWYYARRKDLAEKEYPSRSAPEEVNPRTIREELLPLLEGRDRVWLIRFNNTTRKADCRWNRPCVQDENDISESGYSLRTPNPVPFRRIRRLPLRPIHEHNLCIRTIHILILAIKNGWPGNRPGSGGSAARPCRRRRDCRSARSPYGRGWD